VFSLVERAGKVRSCHISGEAFDQIKEAFTKVAPEAHLMTDESRLYNAVGKTFASHGRVIHSAKEYARGKVTTNRTPSNRRLLLSVQARHEGCLPALRRSPPPPLSV
jgi:ISXO2-like transposase domain